MEKKDNHQLTNVHHAVMQSIVDKQPEGDMVPASFKLHEPVKVKAEEILGRHGVTLSEFCRKCCEGLVRDYIEG